MNDVQFSLTVLESIYTEARRNEMTLAERAGLYAAGKCLCAEFHSYVDDDRGGDGYAHEKVTQYEWHIGAALGFDITNGHDKTQHLSWAFGALSTLRNVLTEDDAAKE